MRSPYHSPDVPDTGNTRISLEHSYSKIARFEGTRADAQHAIATVPLNPSILARWHLLSLDAPTVAVLWSYFIARSAHVSLPGITAITIFVAVWGVYAADRLLDVRHIGRNQSPSRFEARHLFHLRHHSRFRVALGLATFALVPLILVMPSAVRHIYLLAGGLFALWFGLIHLRSRTAPDALPKEIAVGLFFSAATFTPTLASKGALLPALLIPAILFANVCSLNCLFIFAWEHELLPALNIRAHRTTRFGLRFLGLLAIISCAAPLLFLSTEMAWRPLLLALSIAAMLLLLLHKLRFGLSRVNLRAAADLALLTPLLIYPFFQ